MARILIVDDSRTSRKILRGILEEEGYEIVGEARNGQEGIDMFSDLKPDVVTMDITMPVMDGFESMKKIRELSADVKIVMITAAGQRNKIIECLRDGANEFITKPFMPEDVRVTISKTLS